MASRQTELTVSGMRDLWRLLTGWLEAHRVGPGAESAPRTALVVDVTVAALHGDHLEGEPDDAATLRLVWPLDHTDLSVVDAPDAPRGHLRVGDVVLDVPSRAVRRGGAAVDLTGVEFELLLVLLMRAGHPVTRDDLSRHALGRPGEPADRSVDMHVSKLRRKLGPQPGGGARITTVRGVGYVYTLPAG